MNKSIRAAISRILWPLVRMLVRYGVSFGEFRDVARQVFVRVAEREFPIEGRKQSISRIAMLTGIQRKEVSRILGDDLQVSDGYDASHSRGVRVISGWLHDEEFLDAEKKPKELPLEGEDASFTALVRRYSGDLTVRAVFDELHRVGLVSRNDAGQIRLESSTGYVPIDDKEAQFNIVGQSVADLLGTLDHNLEQKPARLQLTTAYDNLSQSSVQSFRDLSAQECRALLARIEQWLASHDRDANPELEKGEGRYRAGVGIYYIEEQLEDLDT